MSEETVNDQNTTQETAQETAQETTQETAQETAQETTQETTQETAQETAQETTQADPAESCNSACSSCAEDCSSRTAPPKTQTNAQSNIKHAIAIVSGKGGVGKSLVTSMIATALHRRGLSIGVLDADITGPSIPKVFGIEDKLRANEFGILPSESQGGIKVVSTNLVLPEDTTPVLWRGAVISGIVKQFYSEVVWGDIDYLLIDMPPGTGDVPLTVYQSISIDGVIIVTAPQDLVSMIVGKAINMARTMNVPVLGIVENMSYFECPDCASKHEIFGASKIAAIAEEYGIERTAQIPILPDLASHMDAGKVEDMVIAALDAFVSEVIGNESNNKAQEASE